jgi:acyl-CoA thioesterase-1
MAQLSIDRRRLLLGVGAAPAAALAQAGAADPFQPIKRMLAAKEPLTWLFTGDSITHGANHTNGWRSYHEHFAERIRWELRRTMDIVINTGISGNRMSGLLKDVEWRVFRFQPSVVSLMMGMNDCLEGPAGRPRYRENLESFLKMAGERKAIPLLHTMNTVHLPDPADARRDLPAYVDIIRDVASKQGVALVDHYQHWSKRFPGVYDLIYVLNDGAIHPNQFGHIEFATLIYKSLGVFDATSRNCRMFVP